MEPFFTAFCITIGILAPFIIIILSFTLFIAVTAWAEQKKWDAHYENPKDKRNQ